MAEIYKSLGASASKAGLHNALKSAGMTDDTAFFAPVIPDIAGNPAYRSFLHADGAGTKCIVAYLLYRETGDVNYFASLAQDSLVMNLDDVFCLGEPESLQLSNLVARNAGLINDEVLAVLLKRYRELSEELADLGILIHLAGGETADCGDVVRTLLVDSVMAGRIQAEHILTTKNIAAGDIIVGLSSCGQAKYEKGPNSGIGSNGLTLARHALLSSYHQEKYPEAVDANLDKTKTYRGPFRVTDQDASLGGLSVGEALLSPTRTYAPLLRTLYKELGKDLHATIHLTGGGQTKVKRFAVGKQITKDNLFPAPAIFRLIQQHGAVPWQEMYQVFNMGHRLEVYVNAKHLSTIQDAARAYEIEAKQVGFVQASSDPNVSELLIRSEFGEFRY